VLLPSNLAPTRLGVPTFVRLPGRATLRLSGVNSSFSSLSLDRLRTVFFDVDELATGGGDGQKGGGSGEVGGVTSEHISNDGRGWVETTGAGGASGSITAPLSPPTCGRGLKISWGEMVRWPPNDNGNANRNGLSGSGELGESGDRNGVQGDSGGVLAASETLPKGECGTGRPSSSSSYGRLMNSAWIYTVISVCPERDVFKYTFLISSSREFPNINGDGTGRMEPFSLTHKSSLKFRRLSGPKLRWLTFQELWIVGFFSMASAIRSPTSPHWGTQSRTVDHIFIVSSYS